MRRGAGLPAGPAATCRAARGAARHAALTSAPVNAGTPTLSIQRFRELWIHTGTACNLSCPFCHEGSKPGDERLQAPSLAELSALLHEAAVLGVERFVFTGGEPLILKG